MLMASYHDEAIIEKSLSFRQPMNGVSLSIFFLLQSELGIYDDAIETGLQ